MNQIFNNGWTVELAQVLTSKVRKNPCSLRHVQLQACLTQ
jgi:hypothetical protein